MILHVLGNSGAYPSPGGACSGFLLENKTEKILLDCGSGCLANLRCVCDLSEITGVICSHLHADHISDLFVLNYALQLSGLKPLPVYAPQTPAEIYEALSSNDYLDVHPVTDNTLLSFGELTCSFCEMKHGVTDFAVKISDGDKTFVYTGDTAFCEHLPDFIEGVHTLLCDCSFLEVCSSEKHLSLPEAVDIANKAKIRHLIMTHFDPEIRPQKYYQFANDRFNGRVSKAEIFAKIKI